LLAPYLTPSPSGKAPRCKRGIVSPILTGVSGPGAPLKDAGLHALEMLTDTCDSSKVDYRERYPTKAQTNDAMRTGAIPPHGPACKCISRIRAVRPSVGLLPLSPSGYGGALLKRTHRSDSGQGFRAGNDKRGLPWLGVATGSARRCHGGMLRTDTNTQRGLVHPSTTTDHLPPLLSG
jgi:hypothetical protein